MADLKEKTYVEDVDRSVYDIRDEEHDAYRMETGLTPEIVENSPRKRTIRRGCSSSGWNPSRFTTK